MSAQRVEVVTVTPFRQNCLLLWDEATREAAVVDPGGDVETILAEIARHGVTVRQILLTHGHLDHAGGVEALRTALQGELSRPPEVLGPHRDDAPLLASIGAQAAAFGLDGLADARSDRYLDEGDRVEAAGRHLEVLHVPGHSPGHVVFIDRANRFAILGDTLFAGTVGRTDFPYSDGPLLLRGIRDKLLPLGDDMRFLCGHGPGSTIGTERRGNPFLR